MRKSIPKKIINYNADHILKLNLKGSRETVLTTLARIKKLHPTIMFKKFHSLVGKNLIEQTSGTKLQKEISELLSFNGMVSSAAIPNEMMWTLSTVLLYRNEIRNFNIKRRQAELAIINEDNATFDDILIDIKNEFGWSQWLIENIISSTQHWYGNDSKREIVRELRSLTKENFLIDVLIVFIGRRVEGSAIPGYLQGELAKVFQDPESKYLYEYVKAKIFDMNNLSVEQISTLLPIDFHSNVIDLYESLLAVLRWIVNNEIALENLKSTFKEPISILYNAIKDERLNPILIALGIDIDVKLDPCRELIIEEYTAGNYKAAHELIKQYFSRGENRDDISILFLGIKTDERLNVKNEYPGLLNQIATEMYNIQRLDEESYSSALNLNSLNDKFKTQAWSNYMRVGVMNELSVQDFNSAIDYLRDLYVLESRISPFSFLLSNDKVYIKRQIDKIDNSKFILTKEVLNLAIKGSVTNAEVCKKISTERYMKYLGRYHIINKNYNEAIYIFNKALVHGKNSEKLKIQSALIISYLRANDLDTSIRMLIDTFLSWSYTPTALPFDEIIKELDDPEQWPLTICLPLTLALYTNFIRNDKLAHLRFSFEKFNLDNNISSPQDLMNLKDINTDHLKLYLQIVWRPEIMGQTLLYNGSNEIEEARIQVCKLLVELDSDNAADYQAEIRERVKNLELSKVADLVDQSRVYVDVSAIKKTLKSKLGDIYAKYKNTLLQGDHINSNFDYVLGQIEGALYDLDKSNESLTSRLSRYHVLGEEDMQFAAMFSEIVNEFLLGEHGLNTYLSTRVRHGKFSNAIRKPITDEHLITELSDETGRYSTNAYWEREYSNLATVEREEILNALEDFGKKIDDIISYVRDELIQVSFLDDTTPIIANKNALFIYRTSSLERIYAKNKLGSLLNIDEFIDFCIDLLWEKTDDNLVIVKNKITGDIKSSILTNFDKLSEFLGHLSYSNKLGELHNHIARAKTNIQHQIGVINSWFNRNEVYDRPDHTPDFPILIAKKMVSNLFSGADSWAGITIINGTNTNNMPGRTLDGMVDIYCALFENAIEHSGLALDELKIIVETKFSDNTFKVNIKNSISSIQYNLGNLSKIDSIRQEISKKDTRLKAQKERGSGFHKIWSTINSPQYNEPKLNFGYINNDTFEVSIQFMIEGNDECNTDN